MTLETSDATLITELQNGNLDALGTLFDRHKNSVYRTALAITRDPAAAEDILQDCFLRIYKYADRINTALPLRPWLYRVTTNLAYDAERKKQRWHIPLADVKEWLTDSVDRVPERKAEMHDIKHDMMDAIASLTLNQRVVIVLYYLNELNVKEISSILDCPTGTIKSRLYYGRENLRHQLEARHPASHEMAYGYA